MCITQLPQQLPTIDKLWALLLNKLDNYNDIKIDNQNLVPSSWNEVHIRLKPNVHIHHLEGQQQLEF